MTNTPIPAPGLNTFLFSTPLTAYPESGESYIHQSLFGDMPSDDCGPWRRRIKSIGKETDESGESSSYFQDASFPKVTISSYTEAGRVESSVTVPNQQAYTILEECITKNYDFDTAYGCLHRILHGNNNWGNIQDTLCRWEEEDQKMQQDALVDTEDHVDVQTLINGYEWPVTIPKDADLNLIRIEMLNLGVEYTWLDVLCLRQVGGPGEDMHIEEWKLDVPTIGGVYTSVNVVWYLSGLGQPLSLKKGDLDSDWSWFQRAWTL
ncbi:hypothetical protein ARMGADRAFT_1112206 [Armillaria gallica]|uniref:Heterokaryon incompatibility domain-containing protein n=1 Tax=Armillaria gallica TaxID=47427 RepID=A0A2H3DGT3_ARMGA|nr:hypothetical protein ARMGADRAFT_1112206 [Armillaria gallica]